MKIVLTLILFLVASSFAQEKEGKEEQKPVEQTDPAKEPDPPKDPEPAKESEPPKKPEQVKDPVPKKQPERIARRYSGPIGFNSAVSAMARQKDGKLVVGGNFTTYTGELCGSGLTRLNADGTLDTDFAFNLAGVFYHAYFSSVVIQPDGKIIAAGVFKTEASAKAPKRGLVRVHSNGKLDSAFLSKAGSQIKGIIESMVLQKDGKIVVGGSFTELNSNKVNGLARLNPDGSLDSGFADKTGSGIDSDGSINVLIIEPEGGLLVFGNYYHFNGEKVNGITRLNSSGKIDSKFLPTEKRPFFHGFDSLTPDEEDDELGPYLPAALREEDGGLVLAGEFVAYNEDKKIIPTRLIRINSDGSLDFDFLANVAKRKFKEDIQSLTLEEDGQILVGSIDPLSRLNVDGTHDRAFLRAVSQALNDGAIKDILVEPD